MKRPTTILAMPAVLKLLKRFCKQYDTDAKAAKALKVTASQLSRTLSGNTNVIHARILKKLGLQAVTMYAPKGKTATKTVKVNRDAVTGRTVSKAVAKANPKTTVTETQVRAVKPKPAAKKPSAPRTRIVAEHNTQTTEDLVGMIDKGPIVIDVTARD